MRGGEIVEAELQEPVPQVGDEQHAKILVEPWRS